MKEFFMAKQNAVQRRPDAGIANLRSEGGAGLAQAFGSKSQEPPIKKKRRKRNPKRVLWRDRKRPCWRERRIHLLAEQANQRTASADCRDGL